MSVHFFLSPGGIQAAKAAGKYAVGVTTTTPTADLFEAGADGVVPNLIGYDVDRLLRWLEAWSDH